MAVFQLPKQPFLSAEHLQMVEPLIRFGQKEIQPHLMAWEENGAHPTELVKQFGDLGYYGNPHPLEDGGTAGGAMGSVLIADACYFAEFGGFAGTIMTSYEVAAPYISRFGSEQQKSQYLPDILTGNSLWGLACSEVDAGTDIPRIRTKAHKEGNEWVLNGSKMYITNGCTADYFVVLARTDPDAKSHRAMSMFIVKRGTEGFSNSQPLKKSGAWSGNIAELIFDNCRIDASNMLGQPGEGFSMLGANVQSERLVMAISAISTAQLALGMTREYAQQRPLFGKTLWDKQVVQHKIASLSAEVEMARQFCYNTAHVLDTGEDALKEVCMAKAHCGELANRTLSACVQLHGSLGYIRESPVENMWRAVRLNSIGAGATEIMWDQVARLL